MRLFLNAAEKFRLDNFDRILDERDACCASYSKLSREYNELLALQPTIKTKKSTKKARKS